jgi:hypothetical protein
MDRLRPDARSAVWLAIYSVCLVCLLSFVFFEMLDVDGSDFMTPNFKTPATPVRAGLRQSTTEGVRQVVLQIAALAWPAITIDLRSVAATALSADRSRATPVAAVVVTHTHRIALPRASLETAPSA